VQDPQEQDYLELKNVVLMSNGTCATHCLFLALKFKHPEIKKIYVPNNCYVAAWNCLLMEYDKSNIEVMKMDIDTWNINTNEDYINKLESNSAVLIVHNLGNIVNVPKLKKIRPDLIFIEDNCEGLFGKYENNYSGNFEGTLCSSVSFYGNKIITTGEGGAFYTSDDEVYEYIKKIYSQGLSKERYLHDLHGYNYRMTNIQAAFLFDQLNDIENILNNKKRIFNNYENLLSVLIDSNKIKLFKKENNTISANWIFSLRIINNYLSIEETYNFFKEHLIDTRPFFYPINSHGHLKDIQNNDEISYLLNKEIIMIPSSPSITNEEQMYVTDTIYKFTFFLENKYKIISINENNTSYLEEFINKIDSHNFRYFKNRTVSVIKNHFLTIVLTDNNIPFGYAHIDLDDDIYWFGICLHKEYQGKGIGNKLMEYIFNHCKVKKLNKVYLTVDTDNFAAFHLYKKHNFIEEKRTDSYIKMCKDL
jgi:perosamine synthetase